ncbi:hypothetical protein [Halioxenophilus aromaticivorans]|uniref:Cytochrome c domain-containing protein n=1 Tax=Halioxenophilus aromaticivorans TaxID=1306992 RepID=A0AAV3U059_9ALTE
MATLISVLKQYRYAIAGFLLLVLILGYVAWDRGFRQLPQPDWVFADEDTRYKYGSIGAEYDAGIPYWIFQVLPRVFPEKLPGPGGYASLGVPWEEGHELPIGFAKKTIGFARVGNNCAVCHTAQYRLNGEDKPVFVPTGPGHTSNVEGFFTFLIECAKDPRFNAENILPQILLSTKLDWIDTLLYKYFIIPITRKRLLEMEYQFTWMFNPEYPHWGPGRDDPMNLTKYFMIGVEPPDDGTHGPTDFPAIWQLAKYKNAPNTDNPKRLNYAGDTWDAESVVIDSALGIIGAEPKDLNQFNATMVWLEQYLSAYPAPKYPLPVDADKAALGKVIYDKVCAACHAAVGDKVGRPLPIAEVNTSPERLATWGKDYAIKANRIVTETGIARRGLVEEDPIGYKVPYLYGLWLRAPYLHNGSVPTLRDLLTPAQQRPTSFYRGYDVLDAANVGFVTSGAKAEAAGTYFDIQGKGNSNQGHEFGTDLPEEEKNQLLEYLKTL